MILKAEIDKPFSNISACVSDTSWNKQHVAHCRAVSDAVRSQRQIHLTLQPTKQRDDDELQTTFATSSRPKYCIY